MPPNEDVNIDHLAKLANLPLSDDERDALENECLDILDAFQLPDHDDGPDRTPQEPYLDDEPQPTPQDVADKILNEAPQRDGRNIKT